MSRARSYCFTINNYTEDDVKLCDNIECEYICYGHETGKSGTEHLQGYIEFANAKTTKRVCRLLGGRAHVEMRMGTPQQASDYCKKEGTFFERGNMSAQGKRSDLEDACELVKDGADALELIEHCPVLYVKYHKGLDKMIAMRQTHRMGPPTVVWIWGPAGTGKTREACNCDSFYIKDGTQWWDNYRQEQRIVIDDFDGKWPFRDLLRLLDRYPYQGQYKGGYVEITSPEIYITCEFGPGHFWSHNDLAQVLRRISEIRNYTEVAGNSSPPLN